MGVFDSLFADDNASQLALAAGLLGGRGSFNQILGSSLNQAAVAGQGAAARKRQADLDDLTKQKFKLALEEEQRKKSQYEALERFRQSIPSPDLLASQNALAGGGGPTVANAQKLAPVDPNAKLTYGALQAGAMGPLDYLKLQQKDTTPIKLGAGEKLLKPGTFQELANNPKDDTTDPFVRLLKQSGIDPLSEQGQKLLQQRALKEATHPEPISVSNYGTPLPVQLPGGGTGYLQPPSRPGAPTQMLQIPGTGKPALKPTDIPASTKKDIAENAVALSNIDNAIDLLGKNPGALGLQNSLGDSAMQRIDPGGIATRASIANIGSGKLHDRSGANVTISEAPRLKPFIPDVRDTPKAAEIKLKGLRREYAAMKDALAGGASITEAGQSGGKPAKTGWSIEPE